jgi:COMPASS component BRE2
MVAPLDVPVGFDGYSYGLRDITGQKVHMSRPRPFMDSFGTGDVIGMHICLPPLPKQEEEEGTKSAPKIFRDRIPIRFRGQLYFEQPDYVSSKEMDELMNPILPPQSQLNPSIPVQRPSSFPTLPGSFINVYKNGIFQGTAFEDLLAFLPPCSQLQGKDLDDGMLGYYPAVSVFKHGIVTLNFGPDFLFPLPGEVVLERGVRPMCERYEEMIKEDGEYDLIDEREWEKEAERMDVNVGENIQMKAEIKELADDEWT